MSEFHDHSSSRKPGFHASRAADWTSRHPTEQDAPSPAVAPARSVTFRILVIAVALIFVNCYWVIEVEGMWHTNHATAMSLFWNTTFFLLLLVLFNTFVLKPFCRSRDRNGQNG